MRALVVKTFVVSAMISRMGIHRHSVPPQISRLERNRTGATHIALCPDTRSRLERLRPLQAALQGRPIPWRKAQGTSVKSWGQNHRCSLSAACLDCPIATAGLRLFRGPWPIALVGHRSCGLTINFFKSSAPQACFLAKLAQLSHTLAARHRIETRSSRHPVAGIQR